MEETMQDSVTSPPGAGSGKSKLDTLSKDDLIKFAKKQMALLHRVKSKCSDLEKEVETLKASPSSGTDNSIIQELTERMDSVLLEKAEIQQNLVLLRKENEKAKQKEQDALGKVNSLQECLDQTKMEYLEKLNDLEKAMDRAHSTHKEEIETLQNLLKKKKAKEQSVALQQFEKANKEKDAEIKRLKEAHRIEVAESKKELDRLKKEVARMKEAHEEELRELTEQMEAAAADFDMERERLLLLQDELAEQLNLKETYLQDVQEEEEDPNRAREHNSSGFPGVSAAMVSDDLQDEMMQLRLAFEDLQSQNTMLQEELTYLTNVKTRLESDLEQVKDEFQHEREELEFKINELQMCKEDNESIVEKSSEKPLILEEQFEIVQTQHRTELQTLKVLHKEEMADLQKNLFSKVEKAKEKNIQEIQELRVRCDQLSLERNLAVEEYEKTKEVLQKFEMDLNNKTSDFVKQCNAIQEQGAFAIDQLQQKLRAVYKEKDILQEEINTLKVTLESSQENAKAAEDLRTSLVDLQRKNEEILSLLYHKENAAHELDDMLTVLSSQKQDIEMQLEKLRDEYNKEQAKSSKLESNVESLCQNNEEIHQRLEELTNALALAQAEKDKIECQADTLVSRLTETASEREQEASRFQALAEEVAKLKEKGETLQDTISTQQETAIASAEERRELRERLQSVSEERDALKKEMEEQQVQLSQVRSRILAVLDQSDSNPERSTENIPMLLEGLLAQTECNRQDLLQQSDAKAAQLVLATEEAKERVAELQAHLEDLTHEKSLLKADMDEVVADMEALQRDLAEMKNVNERMKVENKDLLAQIAEITEKLQAKENEPTQCESPSDEAAVEKEDLKQLLAEKESFLLQLQEEITLLKETKDNSAQSEENHAKQLTKKIEGLQMENKEKEDKINKIKAVAVKAKKELDSSKKEVLALKQEVESLKAERDRVMTSMKDIIQGAEGYKNLQAEYDKQAEQLDQERGRAEEAERQIGDLTKHLQVAIQQHEQLNSEREDMTAHMERLHNNIQQLEVQALEMHKLKSTLEKDLEAERLLKEQKAKDHSAAMKEADDLKAQLQKQKQQLQQTAQELEQLRKEAQQSTLMDMEMAHYERLVKDLNQKLSEKDVRIEELAGEIQIHKQTEEGLQQEIASLKSSMEQREEKASKIKQLLVKTKKDLADAKQNEVAQMSIQASLKGELEAHQQQLEHHKIKCSELMAERHRLQEQLKTLTEQQQRATSSFQQRLNMLQEECDTAKAELATVTSEFESYKVRVHNVLKQQKNKSAQSESDVSKQEREHMESTVEQLRSRLQETQQSLQTSCIEMQQLQAEHDTLLERHNKMLQENVAKEAELRERLLSLQSEHMALKTEHAQTVSQLSAQADTLRTNFREQVRHLQEEHRSTVEVLQQQMSKLESQLFQQQREPNITSPTSAQLARKITQDRKAAELALLDLQSMAREEGEGMETTETESVSSAGTPLPSLEQLLTSPDSRQEPSLWQAEPSKEELTQKLNTATRSMEHMNGLLHETEATNAILMEQITLLKSEVRRLERNQEREKSVANLEYLKNVLLQFIFLKSGSERQALLPVIHTMLQLSPEEKSKLAAIAQGEEESAGSRGSGWTSYLHSWSGIR